MNTSAQQPEGVYTFHRQEMVASFNFKSDNTFEFFYSYGAVDRTASGTFTMTGDTVKLKSNKEAGKDFNIQQQSKKGKNYTVAVTDKNSFLTQNVIALVFIDGKEQVFESDKNGIINIPVALCGKIYLQHGLFPDIYSLIKDDDNINNYFEVTLSPSLAGVSFKGIDLTLKNNTLSCPTNYFMPLADIEFVKEE